MLQGVDGPREPVPSGRNSRVAPSRTRALTPSGTEEGGEREGRKEGDGGSHQRSSCLEE